jgi:serine protease AprX
MSRERCFGAFRFLGFVSAALVMAVQLLAESNPPGPFGYMPSDLPQVLTQESLDDRAKNRVNQIWGFIGRDYASKDATQLSLAFLALQAFDQETRWPPPSRLPKDFEPERWLEAGKDPGLGVREIQRQGYTGKGISVAVIDKPIRSTHRELAGRLTYIEVFGDKIGDHWSHFHGLACASILAGRSCGVAPGARLYYFAVPDNGANFLNYSKAVDRLVEINKGLPADQKIRLVSISDGMIGPYVNQWTEAMGKLKAAKVELVYPGDDILSGFVWGGCPPFLDRQTPEGYELSPYLKRGSPPKGAILIPGDCRTTASNAGDSVYVYWGQGGLSWAVPYIGGLAALAWQIDPRLTYAEIEELLRRTAYARPDGTRVLMPALFIRELKRR